MAPPLQCPWVENYVSIDLSIHRANCFHTALRVLRTGKKSIKGKTKFTPVRSHGRSSIRRRSALLVDVQTEAQFRGWLSLWFRTVAIIEAFYFCACTQPTKATEVGGNAPVKCNRIPAPPIRKAPESQMNWWQDSSFPPFLPCLALVCKWSSRLKRAASTFRLLLAGHQLPRGGKSKQSS